MAYSNETYQPVYSLQIFLPVTSISQRDTNCHIKAPVPLLETLTVLYQCLHWSIRLHAEPPSAATPSTGDLWHTVKYTMFLKNSHNNPWKWFRQTMEELPLTFTSVMQIYRFFFSLQFHSRDGYYMLWQFSSQNQWSWKLQDAPEMFWTLRKGMRQMWKRDFGPSQQNTLVSRDIISPWE